MSVRDVLSPFTAWKNLFRDPVTIRDPFNDRPGAPRYRGFHQNDVEKCIGCGTCETICQNGAIDMVPVEGIATKAGRFRPAAAHRLRPLLLVRAVRRCLHDQVAHHVQRLHLGGERPRCLPLHPGRGQEALGRRRTRLPPPRGPPADGRDAPAHGRNGTRGSASARSPKSSPATRSAEARSKPTVASSCGLCIATCPTHMAIPDYIAAVRDGDYERGVELLYDTNPFSGICGRVCTHQCETTCAARHEGDPIAIRWLKRHIMDQVYAVNQIKRDRGQAGRRNRQEGGHRRRRPGRSHRRLRPRQAGPRGHRLRGARPSPAA